LTLQGKAAATKAKMDEIVAKMGAAGKAEDEYVSLANDFQKLLAEAQRVSNKTSQAKDFVEKYGTRAVIMKKMNQKLMFLFLIRKRREIFRELRNHFKSICSKYGLFINKK
jgi:hypothetical protein